MIKVHMISDIDGNVFQSKVNKFIDDKKIIDIKYQSFPVATQHNNNGVPVRIDVVDRAMIIYEEN